MPGVYSSEADNALPVKHLGAYRSYGQHKAMGGDSSNYDQFSKRILDFKEGQAVAINHFTALILPLLAGDFAVCVVPSHDPQKKAGPLYTLAARLCNGQGRIDLAGTLVRHTKIPKLATGGDRSKDVHLKSVKVADAKPIARKRILLLDDVMTTGGSLQACTELLTTAGASRVWCLALGKTS